MDTKRSPVSKFKGLNNVDDPQRLDMSWLTQADNVDISRTFGLTRCTGFVKMTTNFAVTGAYATKDLQRLYVVDTGQLRQMNADLSYSVLRSGLSTQKCFFEEVNGVVYLANGVDFLAIEPSGARPWGVPTPASPALAAGSGALPAGTYQLVCTLTDDRGMEGGNSVPAVIVLGNNASVVVTGVPQVAGYTTNLYLTKADGTIYFRIAERAGATVSFGGGEFGMELPFWHLDPPRGSIPAAFQGRMYVAEWFAAFDLTVLWGSKPMHFHHFDLSGDGVAVPGRVLMTKAVEKALIIGTERAVFAYDGEALVKIADYGVVPGWHASLCEDRLYFWTLRGLCRALPFENLTNSTVSVPPGLSAGAMVLERDGMRRYIVALQKGGEAYNRRLS